MVRAKCLARFYENDRWYVKGEYIQVPEDRAAKLAHEGKIIGISEEWEGTKVKPVPYQGTFRQPMKKTQLLTQNFMFRIIESGV